MRTCKHIVYHRTRMEVRGHFLDLVSGIKLSYSAFAKHLYTVSQLNSPD